MDRMKIVEGNIKQVLNHWGFGEICASIYAALALSDRPLTAKEISKHIDYAYTTTINALNRSIGLGHIRKMRQGRKNVYYIDSDLSDIIKEKLSHFLEILEETEKSIEQLDDRYRERLKGALKTVDSAIQFLKKMKKTEARA
jgi:DNA-binding transcriptional regulator GbsR (MarR family)